MEMSTNVRYRSKLDKKNGNYKKNMEVFNENLEDVHI